MAEEPTPPVAPVPAGGNPAIGETVGFVQAVAKHLTMKELVVFAMLVGTSTTSITYAADYLGLATAKQIELLHAEIEATTLVVDVLEGSNEDLRQAIIDEQDKHARRIDGVEGRLNAIEVRNEITIEVLKSVYPRAAANVARHNPTPGVDTP